MPLGVYLARDPWPPDARAVWDAPHQGLIVGHIAAHGFSSLFYIARRIVGLEKALQSVGLCLRIFEVVPDRSRLVFDLHFSEG